MRPLPPRHWSAFLDFELYSRTHFTRVMWCRSEWFIACLPRQDGQLLLPFFISVSCIVVLHLFHPISHFLTRVRTLGIASHTRRRDHPTFS